MKMWAGTTFVVALAVPCLALALSGCGVYLHDDDLQKKTDAALATYKSADVPGALKATLAAQSQFDQRYLDNLTAEETAMREGDLAGLLDKPVGELQEKISKRLERLIGDATLNIKEWENKQGFLNSDRRLYDSLNQPVAMAAWRYARVSGKGFTSCDRPFTFPASSSEQVQAYAKTLTQACAVLQKQKEQLDSDSAQQKAISQGLMASVRGELFAVQEEITTDAQKQKMAKEDLAKAKREFDAENKADPDKLTAALRKLDAAITAIDDAAGAVGLANYSPGAVLATVEFRKTNLRDVLGASDPSKSPPSNAAEKSSWDAAIAFDKAVAGAIAGIQKFDSPPSSGLLAIALAYQAGLEAVAEVRLTAVKKKQDLLQHEEGRLLLETELLVKARDALADTKTKTCAGTNLAEKLSDRKCEGAKGLARAVSAYNLSWSLGRTVAVTDDTALVLLDGQTTLQVAQANAIARDKILTTTLTQLAAFGQGGVKPEIIAAFIQAFSTVAIAKGVN